MSKPDVSQPISLPAGNDHTWSNISSDLWVNRACTGQPADNSGKFVQCAPSDVLPAPGTVAGINYAGPPPLPTSMPVQEYYLNKTGKGLTANPWYTFGLNDAFESHAPGDNDPHKVLREIEWGTVYSAVTAMDVWIGLRAQSPFSTLLWGALGALNAGRSATTFGQAWTDYEFNKRAEHS